MISFSVRSFGCRANQAEAFAWTEALQKHGLIYDPDHRRTGLLIINTCTVTSRADADARRFIRRAVRENPDLRMVVTGCLVERIPERFLKDPRIWRVYSNRDKNRLADELMEEFPQGQPVEYRPFRARPPIKIQDGCDHRCRFCIVPSVRGKSVSLSPEEAVKRVRELAAQGFTEVVLTGVHINLYGRDFKPPVTLTGLLRQMESIPGLAMIRLSSLDPRFMEEEFVNFITSSPRVCPHFHLSLQHGADRIIERMGRRISTARYQELLKKIRSGRPDASLGADIIVGFPGETETDFECMAEFIRLSPLNYLHVFSYSPRPGTPAARWKRVKPETVKERAVRLRRLSNEKNTAFRRKFTGRVLDAVVVRKRRRGIQTVTPNYIEVEIPGIQVEPGEDIKVRIMTVTMDGVEGRMEESYDT
ncbi:MAG: tRNA (N(6)-L-threonylcarbamoyladenosine(37)-C(2))-methylthiotransferase MtaB [Candidatus Aminicenantaceae bacterium]